jgi:hypothetical protein
MFSPHHRKKGREAKDLAALIWSFSKSPDATYSSYPHTGELCKFCGLRSSVAENSVLQGCDAASVANKIR